MQSVVVCILTTGQDTTVFLIILIDLSLHEEKIGFEIATFGLMKEIKSAVQQYYCSLDSRLHARNLTNG